MESQNLYSIHYCLYNHDLTHAFNIQYVVVDFPFHRGWYQMANILKVWLYIIFNIFSGITIIIKLWIGCLMYVFLAIMLTFEFYMEMKEHEEKQKRLKIEYTRD